MQCHTFAKSTNNTHKFQTAILQNHVHAICDGFKTTSWKEIWNQSKFNYIGP